MTRCRIWGVQQGTLVCRCAGVATPAKPVWDFEKKKKKKEKGRFLNFFLNFISSYKATTTSVAVSYVHVTPPQRPIGPFNQKK